MSKFTKRLNFKELGSGFTLIELMIAMGVISILSGIIITVINPAALRARGRDAQRVADLKKLQTALELYYSDNRAYPVQATLAPIATPLAVLIPNYYSGTTSSDLPRDPSFTGGYSCSGSFGYQYAGSVGLYVLVSDMETSVSVSDYTPCSNVSNCSTFGCSTCANFCHAVQNPL